MKKILVTGASGLLGTEILKSSDECTGLSSKDCNLLTDSLYSFIEAEHEVVIHCAARVGGVKINTERVADFFDDNMKINMNVFDSCRKKKVKLLSIMSTCIYPSQQYVIYPLTEDQLHQGPPHESNFGYAYAKRMLDIQSRAYRQQYGCNFITAIPNNLYGCNDNFDLNSGHVIPSLIRKFYEAKSQGKDSVEIWGTGRPLREFTYARDAAQIIVWLAKNYNNPEPLNIGNPELISIRDLSELIAEEIQFEGKVVFNTEKTDGQYKKPSSNEKLKLTGYNVVYTPLKQGIKETVAYFKQAYPKLYGIQ